MGFIGLHRGPSVVLGTIAGVDKTAVSEDEIIKVLRL